MPAICYITLSCLLRPSGHLSCFGFNERLLISTAFIFFLFHTGGMLPCSVVCSSSPLDHMKDDAVVHVFKKRELRSKT